MVNSSIFKSRKELYQQFDKNLGLLFEEICSIKGLSFMLKIKNNFSERKQKILKIKKELNQCITEYENFDNYFINLDNIIIYLNKIENDINWILNDKFFDYNNLKKLYARSEDSKTIFKKINTNLIEIKKQINLNIKNLNQQKNFIEFTSKKEKLDIIDTTLNNLDDFKNLLSNRYLNDFSHVIQILKFKKLHNIFIYIDYIEGNYQEVIEYLKNDLNDVFPIDENIFGTIAIKSKQLATLIETNIPTILLQTKNFTIFQKENTSENKIGEIWVSFGEFNSYLFH